MEEPLHAHLRQPILKILHSHGITRASSVSLQVLSSLLDKYLKNAVLSSQEYANHAGRNGMRVHDLVNSLEEMGSTLEDLGDYLEIEGGVRKEHEKGGNNSEEVLGLQRYANVVGPRKEAELSELKESLKFGLTASDDRYAERLRYTRLPTPDPTELEHGNPYPTMAYSSADEDEDEGMGHTGVQLPLSPISNSPPNGRNAAMQVDSVPNTSEGDSYLLPFLPPFPQILPDTEPTEEEKEKEEERQREAELLKQKEALEQQAKNKDKGGDDVPAVQSFPANYIVPAPYDVSKLQSRGTWHLPSISMTSLDDDSTTGLSGSAAFSSSSPLKTANPPLPPPKPYVRGDSTTEELLTALHALTPTSQTDPNNPITPSVLLASTSAANALSTNPARHKVSLVFLGTTPARYNTPDTLFGLAASAAPPRGPAHPLPSYVNVLEVQPGMKGDKAGIKGKNKDVGELPVPPSTGRNVGVPAGVVGAVTGTTSRIPAIGKRVLAKPTLARTKRLAPPPPQKRDEGPLLYHTPKPPLLAHWNMAVSGSNSQYSGALDHANAKAAAEHAKASKEKNPYGVAEATLAYTWDWHAKHPWEGIEWVRGGAAFAPPPPHAPLPIASTSTPITATAPTPGGTGKPGIAVRTVPKISVNFPGRRSSTLSAITPSGSNALIARLPGLAERSPSHPNAHSSKAAPPDGTDTNMERSMLPPPPPHQPVAATPPNQDAFPAMKEDEKDVMMMMMESVLGPNLVVQTPVDDMELDSAISQLAGDEPPLSRPKEAGPIQDLKLEASHREPSHVLNPIHFSSGHTELDGDVDKEIADVLGEGDADIDDADAEVDADIAEALGSVHEPPHGSWRPVPKAPSPTLSSLHDKEPQLDMELAELLEEPTLPSQPSQRLPSLAVDPLSTSPVDDKRSVDSRSVAYDALGVGEPPAPPGEGSAVILSEKDFLPASSGGTLAFASSTTLPLATSSMRSTTTPQNLTPGYSREEVLEMKHEEVTPALDAPPQQPHPVEHS